MPKIDLDSLPQGNTTAYPSQFATPIAGRWVRRLSPASGLSLLGASHVVLKPGAWSSQRHWHASEDEMVVMLTGEAVLVEDGTRTLLRPGDLASFPMGLENGHHLVNESEADCSFIALSAGTRTHGGYPDIDMLFTATGYTRRDGTPY